MTKAFTIIELIFAIVIIGILASVAMPRLAATRTDAKVSAEVESIKNSLNNLGIEYTSKNRFLSYTATDANSAVNCVFFSTATDGNVTVTPIAAESIECPSEVLFAVKNILSGTILKLNGSEKVHNFGGSRVVR